MAIKFNVPLSEDEAEIIMSALHYIDSVIGMRLTGNEYMSLMDAEQAIKDAYDEAGGVSSGLEYIASDFLKGH